MVAVFYATKTNRSMNERELIRAFSKELDGNLLALYMGGT